MIRPMAEAGGAVDPATNLEEAADWAGTRYNEICSCVMYGGMVDNERCSTDRGLNGGVICSRGNSVSGMQSCITAISVWEGRMPDKLEACIQ